MHWGSVCVAGCMVAALGCAAPAVPVEATPSPTAPRVLAVHTTNDVVASADQHSGPGGSSDAVPTKTEQHPRDVGGVPLITVARPSFVYQLNTTVSLPEAEAPPLNLVREVPNRTSTESAWLSKNDLSSGLLSASADRRGLPGFPPGMAHEGKLYVHCLDTDYEFGL